MKNKWIKNGLSIVVVCMLIGSGIVRAVEPGAQFTVTLACGNVEGSIRFTASNATITGGTGNWCNRGDTFTVSLTAGSEGTATVSMIGVDATDSESLADYSGKTIATQHVDVKKAASSGNQGGSSSGNTTTPKPPVVDNRSKDNNLSSLSLSEGELTPAFSSDVSEYQVQLPATASVVTVNATASDSKASVSGAGEVALNPGDNVITVTVTAENGNPKAYVIHVYVDESPVIFTKYGDDELGVVRNLNGLTLLDGFEETTIQMDGQDVMAWHSPTRNITIVYLQKGDVKNYYIFDAVKGITSIYIPLGLLGHNLGIVDVPLDLQEKAGMTYQEVTIDDVTLMGWIFNHPAFKNYSLIYAMDEFGDYHFYQYESSQKTLQLYSGAAPVFQQEYDDLIKSNESMTRYFYFALAGCALCLVVAIVACVNAIRYKKRMLSRQTPEM